MSSEETAHPSTEFREKLRAIHALGCRDRDGGVGPHRGCAAANLATRWQLKGKRLFQLKN